MTLRDTCERKLLLLQVPLLKLLLLAQSLKVQKLIR